MTGKYRHWLNIEPELENENPVCINRDHVDQWRELLQVTEKVSDQRHVLFTSGQEQAKEVIDTKKRKIENLKIHAVYKCVFDIS